MKCKCEKKICIVFLLHVWIHVWARQFFSIPFCFHYTFKKKTVTLGKLINVIFITWKHECIHLNPGVLKNSRFSISHTCTLQKHEKLSEVKWTPGLWSQAQFNLVLAALKAVWPPLAHSTWNRSSSSIHTSPLTALLMY